MDQRAAELWSLPDSLTMEGVALLPPRTTLHLEPVIRLLAYGSLDHEGDGRRRTRSAAEAKLAELVEARNISRNGDVIEVDGLRNWLEERVAKRDQRRARLGDINDVIADDGVLLWQYPEWWPGRSDANTSAHTFFITAVHKVGRKMYGSRRWTGREAEGLRLKHPITTPRLPVNREDADDFTKALARRLIEEPSEVLSDSDWKEARAYQRELIEGLERRERAVSTLIAAAAAGTLVTTLFPQSPDLPQEMTPCPANVWQCPLRDMRLRLHFCRLNLSNPFQESDERPFYRATYAWIFVDDVSLEALLKGIEPVPTRLSKPRSRPRGKGGSPVQWPPARLEPFVAFALKTFHAHPFCGEFAREDNKTQEALIKLIWDKFGKERSPSRSTMQRLFPAYGIPLRPGEH